MSTSMPIAILDLTPRYIQAGEDSPLHDMLQLEAEELEAHTLAALENMEAGA